VNCKFVLFAYHKDKKKTPAAEKGVAACMVGTPVWTWGKEKKIRRDNTDRGSSSDNRGSIIIWSLQRKGRRGRGKGEGAFCLATLCEALKELEKRRGNGGHHEKSDG